MSRPSMLARAASGPSGLLLKWQRRLVGCVGLVASISHPDARRSFVGSTASSILDDALMLTVDDADDLQVCADA